MYFTEHEGTVSTVARHPEKGMVCVSFKVDAHRIGTPDVEGVDLLSVSGVTDTPQTCPGGCPDRKRPSRSSDQ
jgi:hypothetical protein